MHFFSLFQMNLFFKTFIERCFTRIAKKERAKDIFESSTFSALSPSSLAKADVFVALRSRFKKFNFPPEERRERNGRTGCKKSVAGGKKVSIFDEISGKTGLETASEAFSN